MNARLAYRSRGSCGARNSQKAAIRKKITIKIAPTNANLCLRNLSQTSFHWDATNSCSSALGALVGEIEGKAHNNWAYAGDATGLEVIISVKVTRDGEVASANEWRSSGDPIFDRSAVNALRKASPLPFPDDPRCYEHIKEFNFIFTPDG